MLFCAASICVLAVWHQVGTEHTTFSICDRNLSHTQGDVGLIRFRGKHCAGIFGDVGPSTKIGEISVRCATLLGIPNSPINGGVASGVEYFVYTNSKPSPLNVDALSDEALGEALARAQSGGGVGRAASSVGSTTTTGNGTLLSDWALGVVCGMAGTLFIVGVIVAIVIIRQRKVNSAEVYAPLLKSETTDIPRDQVVSPRSRTSTTEYTALALTPGLARRVK